MSGLTQQQLAFFREEGYLLVEDAIDPSVFQRLRAELDEGIDAFARAELADGRLSDAHAEEPFERRLHLLALQLADPAPMLALGRGKQRTPGMFQIYTCPSLLDIVESVIGPEVLAHPQFNIRAKRPYQDEGVVPWHQDLGYLQPDAAETFMVNFWIPLVDATRENGCMEVIAGSHRAPLLDHEHGMGPAGNFKGVIDDQLPDGEHVLCPGARGRRAADPAQDHAPLAAQRLRPHPLEPRPALLAPRAAHRPAGGSGVHRPQPPRPGVGLPVGRGMGADRRIRERANRLLIARRNQPVSRPPRPS